jgi:hypothetical protein
MTRAELDGDVVILVCAVSAGIHGALAPEHFGEGMGAGLGFVAATVALAGLVVWLTARPRSRPGVAAAAAVLLGLLGSYALAVTTGVPLLHPEAESADGLALTTKAIELVGLAAATAVLWRPLPALTPHPKGS